MFGVGPYASAPYAAVLGNRQTASGAVSCSSTAAATGRTTFSVVGTITGATTVSAVGQTRNQAAGSVSASATAAAPGQTRNAASGSTAGSSAAAGVVQGRATGVGSASCSSTADASGRTRAAGVGSAGGVTSPVGVGAYRASAVGTAPGASTPAGVGQTRNAASGQADGSTVLYGYARQGQGLGATAGTSAAAATGQTRISGTSSVAGTSSAAATGIARLSSPGLSSGSTVAAAAGQTRAAAVGSAVAGATAAAAGQTQAQAAGSVSASATTAGTIRGRATGYGAVAGSTSTAATGQTRFSVVGAANGIGGARGYILTELPGPGIKRSGVVFPSYGRDASWSSTSAFDADFPVTNLSDLDVVRRVAVRADPGETVIDFVFPSARTVDMVALIHHNGSASTFYQVQLSSGANPTTDLVHDSGIMALWESALPVPGFKPTRPYRLPAEVSARSGRITLGPNTAPWEIGAVEIGKFWEWMDVSNDRAIGIDARSMVQDVAPGVQHVTGQWSPRIATGNRRVVDQSEIDTLLLDFQHFTGRTKPFLWCWDVNDPATWPREAWLARNRSLVGGVVTDYQAGTMAYDFEEHLR